MQCCVWQVHTLLVFLRQTLHVMCTHIDYNKFSCFCDISEMHRIIVKFVYVHTMYICRNSNAFFINDVHLGCQINRN